MGIFVVVGACALCFLVPLGYVVYLATSALAQKVKGKTRVAGPSAEVPQEKRW